MTISNTTIQLKKSGSTGNIPSTLNYGELALNYYDGKLFYKNASGVITSFSSGSSTNSFSTIIANGTSIIATSPTDILSIAGANGIGIFGNSTSKSVTVGFSGNSYIPGLLNVNFIAGGGNQNAAIQVFTANTRGGIGYADFLSANNLSGTSNTSKWFRIDTTGNFQVINSAYTQNILNLSDASVLSVNSVILNSGQGGSITFQDGTVQTTAAGGASIDSYARQQANAAFIQANTASNTANYANNTANIAAANITVLFGIEQTQNSWISSNAAFTQAAFNTANTANNTANIAAANISIIFGIDQTQNNWISSNAAFTQAAFNTANTANNTANYANNTANIAAANITVLFGIEQTQNSWISSNAAFTQAAFNTANSAATKSGYLANTIIYSNTTGYLSNTSTLQFFAANNTLTTANVLITGNIIASGSIGTTGQYLQSTGSGIQWSTVTSGGGSSSGYLANAVIYANTTGYLSNTSTLQFIAANNTFISSNVLITGNIIASGSIGTSGQYLQSTGSGIQWATVAGGAGSASQSGWLANSVIVANTTGYLSNTSNLQFYASNNTLVSTGGFSTSGNVTIGNSTTSNGVVMQYNTSLNSLDFIFH